MKQDKQRAVIVDAVVSVKKLKKEAIDFLKEWNGEEEKDGKIYKCTAVRGWTCFLFFTQIPRLWIEPLPN
jgi:hypothetical protein